MEFHPQFNVPKKKGGLLKLQTANQLFDESERAMARVHKAGAKKQFWMIDSIANIVTDAHLKAGVKDADMHSKLSRADFLSQLLPRWSGLAANYNAMVIAINQLRDKIGGMGFGEQDQTTGGRALRHACAVRVRVQRLRKLRNGARTIGLAGQLRNIKNKAGAGSEEGHECGFKVLWHKETAEVEFMPLSELKTELFPKE
jgi:RecA/RadA recombinase